MYKKWLLLFIPCFFLSCEMEVPQQGGSEHDTTATASVSFINESSYRVELYQNVNPSIGDTNTEPVVALPSGETKTVQLPPSTHQTIGDTFYIHYAAMLDNGETNGGNPVYAKARQDIWNITFVIQSGESYTKKIEQPSRAQLRFPKVYLKIMNESKADIQLVNGSKILKNLGSETVNVKSGTVGVYELDLPDLQDELSVSSLQVYVSGIDKYISIDQFNIKQGNLAVLRYRGAGGIVGPTISSLVK